MLCDEDGGDVGTAITTLEHKSKNRREMNEEDKKCKRNRKF